MTETMTAASVMTTGESQKRTPVVPADVHNFAVSDGYTLHVETHGNPSDGTWKPTILYFHGGWGPLRNDLELVPLNVFQVIYFHQRGWGKSTPTGSVSNNTLDKVVEDAKLIHDSFSKDKKVVVFGGSNGATIALKYAAKHSDTISGVVLRGYWAMTPEQISWDYFGAGKRSIFPEEWKKACEIVECEKAEDFLSKFKEKLGLLTDENAPVSQQEISARTKIGCAWLRFDALGAAINAVPRDVCIYSKDINEENLTMSGHAKKPEWFQLHPLESARIGVHIYAQEHRIPDLSNLLKREDIIVHFIHGRFDMLCPPKFGFELTEYANRELELSGRRNSLWKTTIVEHAAHSDSDPGMGQVIRNALLEIVATQDNISGESSIDSEASTLLT